MAKYRTYSRKTKRSPEAVHSVKQEFEAVTDLPLPTGPQHVKMKPKHELVKEEPLRKEKNPAYLYSTESSLDAAHAVKQEIDVGPTVLQPTYLPSVLKEPKHETSNEETSHIESSLDAVRAFKQEIDVGPTVLQPTYLPSVLMEPKHETSDEETSQIEEEPACSHNTESSPDAARAIKQDINVDPTLLQPKYLPWIEPKLETSNEETAQMEENPACSYYTESSLDAARAVKQELDVGPTLLQPTDLPCMMMEPKLETTNEETSQLSAERIRNNLALHRKRLRAQSTEPQTECKAKKTKKELHSEMLPGLTVDGKNSKSSFLSSERTPLCLGTPAELLDTLSPPLERPKASRTYSRVKSKAPSSSVADPSRLDVPEAVTSSDSSQLNRNSGADGGTMKIESEKGQGLISPITCDRFTTPTERSPTSPNNFEVVGGSESSSLAPSHATWTTESSSIPHYAGSLKTCALLMTPGGSPIIKSRIEEVGESGTDLEGGLDAASDVDITEHQSAVESIDLGFRMPLTNAERSRRYREKLKRENPEQLEAQRLKNLQRIKSKKKKISQMTQQEAEERRKAWREEKFASRQKQRKSGQGTAQNDKIVAHNGNNYNNDPQSQDIALASQSHYEKTVRNLNKKNTYLINKCRRFIAYNGKLKILKDIYKKRYQRLQQQKEQELNDLKTELMKVKAREEILEHTLKKTYL